jgi:pimeloyl-ACP methyl ester carboxylesterase
MLSKTKKMETKTIKGKISNAVLSLLCVIAPAAGITTTAHAQAIKNVVLVHGAFADGSGWKGVYKILTAKGYHVTIVQNPATSLEDDVKATNEALDKQNGPAVLVGHSWGGAVITEAGNHAKVASLVYVAAFQPDNGESALQLFQSAPPAVENGVLPPDEKGIVYYDLAKFHEGFCADLDEATSDFMAASQVPFYAKGFITPISDAAWKHKPAYAIVSTEDKSINPVIQRRMYKRSNSKVTEIKASHAVYISQPERVAEVIMKAATNPTE